jgi:hypothetical protein
MAEMAPPDNGYGPMRTETQSAGAHPYAHLDSFDPAGGAAPAPMDTDAATPGALSVLSPPLLSNAEGQAQLALQTANANAPVPSDALDDSHFRSKIAADRRRTREKEAQLIGLLLNSRGYPVRPGAAVCQYYLDYNKCSYGTSCVMHHPDIPGGTDNDTWSDFSDEGPKLNKRGYIRRPGKAICSFYQKSGHCGFGPQCRFDHPEGIDGPMAPPMTAAQLAQAIAIGGEEDAKGKDGKGKDGKGKGFDKGKGNKGFDKGKGKDKSLGKGQLGPQGPPSQMPQMGNKGKGGGGGAVQYVDQNGNPLGPPPPGVQYVDQNGNPVGAPPPGVQYVDQYGNPVNVGASAPGVQYVDQNGNPVGAPPPGVQYVDQFGNPVNMGGPPPGMGMQQGW